MFIFLNIGKSELKECLKMKMIIISQRFEREDRVERVEVSRLKMIAIT